MASSADQQPIWARPEPGTRRPRFSREQIATTALAIADAEGFDAVSMRRLAAELGAGTMTLYHYVRTKDDLVALMDDAMMAELIIPADELPTHWHAAMTAIANRTREVLSRHVWAMTALRNAQIGPNAMRHVDQTFTALAGTDLDVPRKFALMAVVDDFVNGNVMRMVEVRAGAEAGPEAIKAAEDYGRALLETGDYPEMTRIFGHAAATADRTEMEKVTGGAVQLDWFAEGLRALLDGLGRRMGLDIPADDPTAAPATAPTADRANNAATDPAAG